MSLQPITVFWRPTTPNPAKVLVILEELGVPYKGKNVEDVKAEPFILSNPNGRVPAIHDPNTNITLWESGAIVSYLIETYDKDNKISFPSGPEKFYAVQWQHFQATGQGPYFGQAAWFILFHSEKVESAQVRYINEIKRVAGVLDGVLKDKEWLVGGKCSYADLSFVNWNGLIPYFMSKRPEGEWNIDDFPNFKRWQEAMLARPSLQKVMAFKEEKDVVG